MHAKPGSVLPRAVFWLLLSLLAPTAAAAADAGAGAAASAWSVGARDVAFVLAALALLRLSARLLPRRRSPQRIAPRAAALERRKAPATSAARCHSAGAGPDWSAIVHRRPLPDGAGSVRARQGRPAQPSPRSSASA